MKLEHLKGMPSYFEKIRVEVVSSDMRLEKGLGKVALTTTGETLRFTSNEKNYLLGFKNKKDKSELESILKKGFCNLAEITLVRKNGDAELSIVFFLGEEILLGNLNIQIPDAIYEKAHKKLRTTSITTLFSNTCIIRGDIITSDECYIPIMIGAASDNLWDSEYTSNH